jgi:hypothetical protein
MNETMIAVACRRCGNYKNRLMRKIYKITVSKLRIHVDVAYLRYDSDDDFEENSCLTLQIIIYILRLRSIQLTNHMGFT